MVWCYFLNTEYRLSWDEGSLGGVVAGCASGFILEGWSPCHMLRVASRVPHATLLGCQVVCLEREYTVGGVLIDVMCFVCLFMNLHYLILIWHAVVGMTNGVLKLPG
jgi:hypothetical protein